MAIKIVKSKEPATAPRSGSGGSKSGGRPRIPVPEQILTALTKGAECSDDESLKVTLANERTATRFVSQLIKGAKELELRLFKTVTVLEDGTARVNFRTESKTSAAELFE